jgi:hypothetical protein
MAAIDKKDEIVKPSEVLTVVTGLTTEGALTTVTVTDVMPEGNITTAIAADPLVAALPPAVAKERVLTRGELIPSNWELVAGEGEQVQAFCGAMVFTGTVAEFNAMLKSGKIKE